ncbi:mating-type protein A-alpha Y4 [Schizophyllum fasciatum]
MAELLACLQSISAHAKDMMNLARSRGASGARPSTSTRPHFNDLLPPNLDFVRARLQEARLPPKSIQGTLSAYETACARWRHDVEEAFDRTAQSISPSNLPALDKLRTRLYVEQVEKWLSEVLQVPEKWKAEMEKQRAHIGATMGPARSRPKFHSEYTPLLDLYFRFNAYPTYADRRVLAEKTGMLTRQITVWFQNHRRRAKGPLPRMSPTAKIPMEEFERERENMARKMIPLLLPPHLKPFAFGGEKYCIEGAPSKRNCPEDRGNVKCGTEKQPSCKPKTTFKTPSAGPSASCGPLAASNAPSKPTIKKKSKKAKTTSVDRNEAAPDVQMKDATTPKTKRRKLKKMPASSARLATHGNQMDVDERRPKDGSTKVVPAFGAAAELAYAKSTYPNPSKYAWVHTMRPTQTSPLDSRMKDVSQLGKGRPPSQTPASTVPKHRVSSRLNAMRPPYAFPARYDPNAVPLTFRTAHTTKFTFVTDSASFGFKSRLPRTRPPSVSMAVFVPRFDSLRLLCAEPNVSQPTMQSSSELDNLLRLRVEGLTAAEASFRQVSADSYAARRAVTCIAPRAPLASVVVDLALALRQRRVSPLVPLEPIVQPDAFAPFIALAEKRAKRKSRKEKKLQAEKEAKKLEKQARKDKKERKKAGLPHRAPLSFDARDLASRASSIACEVAVSSRKLSKKAARKAAENAPASRASSVASTTRTPSLSSTSSRRTSSTSMPGTPSPEQSLPIMAGAEINFGGDDDSTMTPELMAQLFGDNEGNEFAGDAQAMQAEPFSQDMLTFSYADGGALGNMTSDVNMPGLGDFSLSQPGLDDMNWAASLGLGAQDSASFDSLGESPNMDLNWLLGQDYTASHQASSGFTDPCHAPLTATSQINVLGGTFTCELGGVDNTSAPLDFGDLTFGLGPAGDGFTGFGSTPLTV